MNRISLLRCARLLFFFCLFGCSVGPNFHKPTMPVPESWPDSTSAAVSYPDAQAEQLAQWWKNFSDATLDSLIARSFQSNLDVRAAESRIRQARAARRIALSEEFPSLSLGTGYTRSNSGTSNTGFAAEVPRSSTKNLFQLGFDSQWEIDIFGGTRRAIEAANSDLQAQEEDRRNVFVTLSSEVALNYFHLRGLQQQILLAQENLEAQRRTAELTHSRFASGFASALDSANAEAQVATTESQIPTLEAERQKVVYASSVLLGLEPAALETELSTVQNLPAVPPEVPVGLPSQLLRRRPDIRSAEARAHAASARIGVAISEMFPKFALTASVGVHGDDAHSLSHWSNRLWSFGPDISLPLFTAGRLRANVDVQNELHEQSLIAYQQSVLSALQEVDNALVDYAREHDRRSALETAVKANQKAVALSSKLYAEGQTDFLNVLSAQRSLFASQDALVQSTQNLATDLVALYKSLGGGWEDGSGETSTQLP